MIPLLYKTFWNQKLSEAPENPPSNFFCETKSFRHLFCDTFLYGLPKILHPTNGQRQNFSETPRTFHRQKKYRANIVILPP